MIFALFALLPFVSAATYPVKESWKGDNFLWVTTNTCFLANAHTRDGFNYDISAYDNTTK